MFIQFIDKDKYNVLLIILGTTETLQFGDSQWQAFVPGAVVNVLFRSLLCMNLVCRMGLPGCLHFHFNRKNLNTY